MLIATVVVTLFICPQVLRSVTAADTEEEYVDVVVEAACGECMFDMPGRGCDLAVRIDGKAYYVDGTGIDDHGDAHADDGFCNTIRRARVSGSIENDRFVVTSFELLPVEEDDE